MFCIVEFLKYTFVDLQLVIIDVILLFYLPNSLKKAFRVLKSFCIVWVLSVDDGAIQDINVIAQSTIRSHKEGANQDKTVVEAADISQ